MPLTQDWLLYVVWTGKLLLWVTGMIFFPEQIQHFCPSGFVTVRLKQALQHISDHARLRHERKQRNTGEADVSHAATPRMMLSEP